MEALTKRQKEVLDFVKKFIQNYKHSPTLQEIGDGVGIFPTEGVGGYLKILERKGYIVRDHGMARSVRIKENGEPVVYLSHAERRTQMLDVALEAARRLGHYRLVWRSHISGPLNVSPGLVSHYLGSADEMYDTILRHAIDREAVDILAQGLLAGSRTALAAPEALKKAAARLLR